MAAEGTVYRGPLAVVATRHFLDRSLIVTSPVSSLDIPTTALVWSLLRKGLNAILVTLWWDMFSL
jgi:hypothetical protein